MAPTQPKTSQRGPRGDQSQPEAKISFEAPPGDKNLPPVQPGDEIVICGIAGRFPDSDNIQQLRDSLMRGADLITADDRRWKLDHPEIPPRSGKINGLEKFDASFFGVHFKQAHTMDPMCRLLLERSYEAVIDAGVNPRTLRGKRVGVYVGACFSESEKTWFYEKLQLSGFGITGCSRAMLANRVSYWLGAKGPTYSLDAACSSSLYAFHQAYEAMRSGQIDAAVVGGTNLVLHPYLSLQFMRLGVLSPQGECKPFDEEASGYVRSEAIVAVFLQRSKDARRIYSTVINAGANSDGFKEQGITYPSGQAQAELMRETCRNAGVDAGRLVYVEAHATGTKVGDPEELAALDEVFCKEPGRRGPLLVGSVKSNLGHTEPVSGLCSIAKVIIAMEEQVIPPTINYKRCRRAVEALNEGRIKVVTEPTPWKGGVVAVNSFGFGGANAHILLQSPHDDRKPTLREEELRGSAAAALPRLVLVSGRTREGVDALLGETTRHAPPHEGLVNLLHSIHEENIPGHIYRGFVVAGAEVQVSDAQYWSGEKRPVWFVFSGMGSQWPSMGAALMQLPVFAAAIQRCHAVLQPRGIDIVRVITDEDPNILDNILNCFVGIAAVQIGLVDILREVGIEADFLIGHSVGELGCAYADGCLTAEQTVLAAYSRGRASLEAKLIPGAMAAIGMGASQLKPLCPPDIDIACHNSADSATVSGPAHSLRAFVESLKAKGIFAKEVPCGNIAYHSRYIKPAGDLLIKYLKEVIPSPRPRSERWLSSSVPEGSWDREEAKLCSAEYQTNNLLRSVLFEQVLSHVPSHAIAVEIAPHGLLQAILKRALPAEVLNAPLTKRGSDSLLHVLSAVGRLYNAGLQPRPAALYPSPQWPVPRGTPMLSPLVRWAHDDDWFVTSFRLREKAHSAERHVNLAPQEEDNELMDGHIIDGRPLIPATGYLKLVWQMMADLEGRLYIETAIVFEDVRFLRATHLPKEEGEALELTVMVHRGTGQWEVSDNGTPVATGRVRLVENAASEFSPLPPAAVRGVRTAPGDVEEAKVARAAAAAERRAMRLADPYYFENEEPEEEEGEGEGGGTDEEKAALQAPATGEDVPDFDMSARHVYKCLRLRGYQYKGLFRGIVAASPDGQRARIRWNSNWVSFLDAMLQVQILANESKQLYVPTSIQKLVVDSPKFLEVVEKLPVGRRVVEVRVVPELDVIACPSVEVRGLFATAIARRRTLADPVLEHYDFIPFMGDAASPCARDAAARVCAQLTLENRSPITRSSPPLKVAELLGAGRRPLMPHLLQALSGLPLVQAKATVFLEAGAALADGALDGATTSDAANLAGERDVVMLVLNAGQTPPSPEAFAAAGASLGVGGALLVVQSAADARTPGVATALAAAAAPAGLRLAARLPLADGDTLLHFRKGGWRVDPSQLQVVRVPELAAVDGPEAFAWVERLKEALKDPNPAEKRVVLVARGPLNGALGLFNCLRAEPGTGPHLVRLYLLPEEADVEGASLDVLGELGLRERLELDLAVNVLQGGVWGSMRHLQLPAETTVPARHAYVDTAVAGDLSSLSWFQGRIDVDRPLLPEGDLLVHVHYASLNFRDIMIASGRINAESLPRADADSALGFEFSGRLEDGRRVMGMKLGGGISTEVSAPSFLLWEIPEYMTMQEAATIPAAYATVIYALDMVGRMQAGESLLVHAASGAVGQAAITLALASGCRVFATVGTQEKKDFLLNTFPQLDAEDIGNSRDTSFEQLVLRRSQGKGVDLVLNSLAEDKLHASLRCLGKQGRFLEIGKVDMISNTGIGMRMLLKQTSVHGILLDAMLADGLKGPALDLVRRMQRVLTDGIPRRTHTHVFSRDQVQDAFRLMAAGKHIGKVLIAVREGEAEVGDAHSKPLAIPARPRFYCDPDASYVISGGLGGLGLELSHWLVERGARALVLVSRRGVATGYQARRLQQWRARGVRALVRTDDAATAVGAETLLRAAHALAPVAALFNLAVVLRDALFDNQTPDAFAESFRCKASAAVHLDAASRRLCPRLRHFVLFSSVSCGRGNAGQTNYGLTNGVMERVARARRAQGLPAVAVQWGAVGDVGLVADMRDDDKLLEIGGTLQQKLSSCLDTLDVFMSYDHPVLASMVVAEKRAGAGMEDLVSAVASLLGFRDLKSVSHESSLAELGMDSMMAVEIQQALARDFDVLLAPGDVRALTFARLREIQREKAAKEKQSRAAPVAAADLQAAAPDSNAAAGAEPGRQGAAQYLDEAAVTLAEGRRALATEGLRQLVRAIGDELTAAQPLVPLASAASSGSGSVAVIFPGVEGVATPMEALARGLTRRAAALQLPFGKDVEPSVPAIVDTLMPHISCAAVTSSCGGGGGGGGEGFVLVGYSYGGLLALEAAARLEAQQQSSGGHLVLLDSAPAFMRAMASLLISLGAGAAPQATTAQAEASATAEGGQDDLSTQADRLQEELLIHMLLTYFPDKPSEQIQASVRSQLAKLTDWESRLELFVRLSPDTGHSKKYKMEAVDAIYRRILSALSYEWPADRPKLQSTVTLIRPSVSALPPGHMPEDYGLSALCARAVRVVYVAGADHYTLPSRRQTAALANAALDEGQRELNAALKEAILSPEINVYRGLKSLHN